MDELDETDFWGIIQLANHRCIDFESRISYIIASLVVMSETDILGFEKTFRKVLSLSSTYGLLAAQYLIEGSVSDDSFLYFRSRLIAEGCDFYFRAIEKPDILAETDIQEFYKGEEMLYVTDRAFIEKFGEHTYKQLPRDVFHDYFDYNFETKIVGEDWVVDDLPTLLPILSKKYSNN